MTTVLEHRGVGTQRCRNMTNEDRGAIITSLVFVVFKVTRSEIHVSLSVWLQDWHFCPRNFARLKEWPNRICKFKRFRDAFNLDKKSEQKHVSPLIYSMGEKAEYILWSFQLTKKQQKSYTTIRDKFQSFFMKTRNIVYERCRFNLRYQEEGESATSCISN